MKEEAQEVARPGLAAVFVARTGGARGRGGDARGWEKEGARVEYTIQWL